MSTKDKLTGVFSRHAEAYRSRLDEWMAKGQAAGRDTILDYVKPRPGMRILDLACGPGTLTIPMASELNGSGEVVGIDLAQGMLDTARAALAGRSLPVRFLRMDIESLQFPLASFDAATCGHGLHFLPNFGRALAGVRRVLKNRARFAASLPGPDRGGPDAPGALLAAAFDARLGKSEAPPELARTRALVADLDQLSHAALAAGFRIAEAETVAVEVTWDSPVHFVTVQANWWANARRLEGLSEHVRELVLKEAADQLEKSLGGGPFTTTDTANVLRAEV
ncbi:MAG TPA: class I SAM-dependent methyltransferase [Candidatus Dormibacteraeota bacterium]|nr:class I SAM-dependent methyltransferase [Candidatus Dormibacteraeota bacterium]